MILSKIPNARIHLTEGHILRSFPTTDSHFLCWAYACDTMGEKFTFDAYKAWGLSMQWRDGAGMVYYGNMTSLRLSGGERSWELQLRISNYESDIVRGLRCGMSHCDSGSKQDLIRSGLVAIVDVLHGRLAYVGTRESYLEFITLLFHYCPRKKAWHLQTLPCPLRTEITAGGRIDWKRITKEHEQGRLSGGLVEQPNRH